MKETVTIRTERVDDIPLLLAHMQRMGLATLLERHFPTHGNRSREECLVPLVLLQKFLSSAKRSVLYPLRKVKRVKGVRIFSERIRSYRNSMINFAEAWFK